jgi:hypothetical protein
MLTLAITYRRRAATARDQRYYLDADRMVHAALMASGVLRQLHKRLDGRGVVLLIETDDAIEARAVMEALPTVEMGACGYTAVGVVETTESVTPAGQPLSNMGGDA